MVDVEGTWPGRQKYPGDGPTVESRAPDNHLDIVSRRDGFNPIVYLAGIQGFRIDGGCPGVELPDVELIADPGELAGDRLSRFPLRVSLEREHPNPVTLVHGDHRVGVGLWGTVRRCVMKVSLIRARVSNTSSPGANFVVAEQSLSKIVNVPGATLEPMSMPATVRIGE
jgi:hypothetical protein